jgi:hypothetical protein
MKARLKKNYDDKPAVKTKKQQIMDAKKRALAGKVDQHIRIIKTLIVKMEELEMQELYNGLLANVLSNPQLVKPLQRKKEARSIPVLSPKDLSMIKQLSSLTDQLYNKMGDID